MHTLGYSFVLRASGFALMACLPSAWAESWILEAGGLLSGGGWTSNEVVHCVSAVGGGTLGAGLSSAKHRAFSGQLNTFVLRPDLDLSGNGIPDENDPDDDADGLSDRLELAGSAFDPSTATNPRAADSDGDGVPDAEESVAGTNPLDAASMLELLAGVRQGGTLTLAWRARGGVVYDVLAALEPGELRQEPQLLGQMVGPAGQGVWNESEASFVHQPGSARLVYGIRVSP